MRAPKKLKSGKWCEREDGLIYEVNAKKPFTGISVEYWPSGQKLAKAEFRDGKSHGTLIAWYESGQKQNEVEFRDGELISIKMWDEDGNLTYSQ